MSLESIFLHTVPFHLKTFCFNEEKKQQTSTASDHNINSRKHVAGEMEL